MRISWSPARLAPESFPERHQYYVLAAPIKLSAPHLQAFAGEAFAGEAFSYQRITRSARSVFQRLGSPTDSANVNASASS